MGQVNKKMPLVSSQTVNKAIRQKIWPELKSASFRRFTARNAWRFECALHVVNFQSFNSYNAHILGCTTFSFSVNLRLYFDFMPWGGEGSTDCPDRLPNEAKCVLHKSLRRRLPQPSNPDFRIWSVDPTGANTDLCVADALEVIKCEGLPWFAEFSKPLNALRLVEMGEEQFDEFGPSGTWGYGRQGSPMRNQVVACLRRMLAATQ